MLGIGSNRAKGTESESAARSVSTSHTWLRMLWAADPSDSSNASTRRSTPAWCRWISSCATTRRISSFFCFQRSGEKRMVALYRFVLTSTSAQESSGGAPAPTVTVQCPSPRMSLQRLTYCVTALDIRPPLNRWRCNYYLPRGRFGVFPAALIAF